MFDARLLSQGGELINVEMFARTESGSTPHLVKNSSCCRPPTWLSGTDTSLQIPRTSDATFPTVLRAHAIMDCLCMPIPVAHS